MQHPYLVMSKQAILDSLATKESSMMVGFRNVPAKNVRLIIPRPDALYYLEGIFRFMFAGLMKGHDMRYQLFSSPTNWWYSLETGSPWLSMGFLFVATSNPQYKTYSADCTTMDGTLVYRNSRVPLLNGFHKIIDHFGIAKNWLETPYKMDLHAILDLMWGKGSAYDAHYLIRNAGESVKIICDHLKSGENLTSYYNSLYTLAQSRCFQRLLYNSLAISSKGRLVCNNGMGDDTIQIYDFHTQPTMGETKEFCEKFVQLGRANGIIVKDDSLFRTWKSEYLKKFIDYGIFEPYNLIQLFGRERPKTENNPLQTMQGFKDVCSFSVERGLNNKLVYNLFLYMWRLHSGVRIKRFKNLYGLEVNLYIHLPLWAMHLPREVYGLGCYFGTCLGPNVNACIALKTYELHLPLNFMYDKYASLFDALVVILTTR